MEINEQNINNLRLYLERTLSSDPALRRAAERDLESIERNQGYSQLLLSLLERPGYSIQIYQAAAIMFKNFVRRNWRVVDEVSCLSNEDRAKCKARILPLMLQCVEKPVQIQLSEAVSLIGLEDFPERWPDLLPSLVAYFDSGDWRHICGCLQTAHSLFKRYRYEMKSADLWTEIKHVLDQFAQPLTKLFLKAVDFVSKQQQLDHQLREALEALILCTKIFYSLNAQDLPEFFEDNMKVWMDNFLALLKFPIPVQLDSAAANEPGLGEHLRTNICMCVTMYAQKYDEEFSPFLPSFVETIWQLLLAVGSNEKYDLLVCSFIQFLARVAERAQYRHLFEDDNTLRQICEKVIIPNLEFRKIDQELFEDNAQEYIRKDIEGSDEDTRRRAACDLIRALCKQFESAVISIFSQYVQFMLQQYASNPVQNWRQKDAAIYLVISLATRGQTSRHGVTHASEFVNLQDFYESNIVADLNDASVDNMPVLKADALKYLVSFRQLLGKNNLVLAIPACVRLLRSSVTVVHTYAAHALERIFTVKQANVNRPLIEPNDVGSAEMKKQLISNLFHIFSFEDSKESDYAMKCIMRSISLLHDDLPPLAESILLKLCEKILEAAKNPCQPHFNHYLFESICILIRSVCKSAPENICVFEQALFPTLTHILQQDIGEFMPYAFQVLSLLLQYHKAPIPQPYMALFPFLLTPPLYDRPGLVPGLIKLLQAYIQVDAEQVHQELGKLLGVFQKLIASKSNDHEGFYLLNSLLQYMASEYMSMYWKDILILLFRRLQNSKTTKFVKSLLVFLSLFAVKSDPKLLIELCDQIQDGIFAMMLDKVIIADLQKVSGSLERKICSVGMTRLLCNIPVVMLNGIYGSMWPRLLDTIVGVIELPEEDAPNDEHFIEVEDTPGYSDAYSQLAFAGIPERDCTGVVDVRIFLAKSLEAVYKLYPVEVRQKIGLAQDKIRDYLQSYFQAAEVHLF